MVKKFNYGGQAVIEGVMMRGQAAMVTAVRRSDGGMAMDTQLLPAMANSRMRKTPFIRGVVALIEAMVLGVKSLLYSANVSIEEEKEEKLSGRAVGGIVAGSVAFAVAVFFMGPLFLTRLIDDYIESSIVFHLVEGFVRLGIFVAYLKLLTLSTSLRRIFAYHGAEHKAVNAYEAGVPLEVGAVREYSTAHTRCGTSFLFVVLIIAIIVFALIGRPSLWLMVLSRVILIPVIASLGYEITQFGARHIESRLVRAFLAPGLWLQRLTTREPDDSQLEVALSALRKAVEIDQLEEAEPAASG
ncbi:MAG: DUF1385 domain-containing protein [Chloroflexi bacterium]|nr:DUF1385 domain-containing protein [Chloroflexota bacterium]